MHQAATGRLFCAGFKCWPDCPESARIAGKSTPSNLAGSVSPGGGWRQLPGVIMIAVLERIGRSGKGLGLALALCLLPVWAVQADSGKSFTLGVVPQFEQRKVFSIWKPIADELSRRTGLDIRLAV